MDYKILMDDYLLAATGKSLHEEGEVSVADFGRVVDGEFVVVQSFVDKRPWLYPFLVSVAHDVLGYDWKNPFRVNVVLGLLLLVSVFVIAHRLAGLGGAVLATLLWASLPLLQQNATGGGMEMLNLFMLHLVILLAFVYLRAPSVHSESLLCLAGVLLTYSRYESGIFLGAIVIVVVLGWLRAGRIFLSWGALLSAPLLLAVLLQTRIYAATESSWELSNGSDAPFAFSHLLGNIPHAFAFFGSTSADIANSLLIGLIALPSLLGFVVVMLRSRGNGWWREPGNQVWVVFALFLVLNLLIVLSFHAAQFDKRYVARYSLPAHGLIVFSAVVCLARLPRPRLVWPMSIAVTIGFLALVTLPKNAAALYTKANFMISEQHWLEAFDRDHMKPASLVIDRFNVAWTLRERSALAPHVAWISADRIRGELEAGRYSEVFLVQRLSMGEDGLTVQVPATESLLEVFQSELVAEDSFRKGTQTRIFRLRP